VKESEIQKAVFQNIAERGEPRVLAWAVPNTPEARRVPGFKAGAHDISILKAGEFFSLELKTEEGEATPQQRAFHAGVKLAGGEPYIAHGLDDALAWLELQGIIRRAQ